MKKIFRVSKRFLRNIKFLLQRNLREEFDQKIQKKFDEILFNQISLWYEANPSQKDEIKNELQFFQNERRLLAFPYPQKNSQAQVESGFDKKRGLPFVVHNSKRLYFPKNYSQKAASETYKNYIETENLLGIENVGGGVYALRTNIKAKKFA